MPRQTNRTAAAAAEGSSILPLAVEQTLNIIYNRGLRDDEHVGRTVDPHRRELYTNHVHRIYYDRTVVAGESVIHGTCAAAIARSTCAWRSGQHWNGGVAKTLQKARGSSTQTTTTNAERRRYRWPKYGCRRRVPPPRSNGDALFPLPPNPHPRRLTMSHNDPRFLHAVP